MSTFTLPRLDDVCRFERGMIITFAASKPWYVLLWRWVTRYDKHHPAMKLTVTSVDHMEGTITVSS